MIIYLSALTHRPAEAGCDLPGSSPACAGDGVASLLPVRSCTARGLSCLLDYSRSGGLLPRRFTLIRPKPDGLFSVTLSVDPGFRTGSPAFHTRLAATRCPDFPLRSKLRSDHLPQRIP